MPGAPQATVNGETLVHVAGQTNGYPRRVGIDLEGRVSYHDDARARRTTRRWTDDDRPVAEVLAKLSTSWSPLVTGPPGIGVGRFR